MAAAAPFNTWPFVVLVVSVAFVIIAISALRMHAFLALILAALVAGVMADKLPGDPKAPEKGQMVRAVELTAEGFGKTAGGIAPRLPPDLVLERVRILEDPTLYADCTGAD